MYVVAQKEHRIKEIIHLHELGTNIFIMDNMLDQKSAGDLVVRSLVFQ